MDNKYYLKHNFIEKALTAHVSILDSIFKNYIPLLNNKKFPIYYINNGDDIFIGNLTDNGKDQKEHYTSVPRMVLSMKGIQVETDQLTAGGIAGRIGMRDDENRLVMGMTHLRRIPMKIGISCEVTFTKLHEYLSFVEFFLMNMANCSMSFQFLYEGVVHNAVMSNVWDYDRDENLTFEFGSEKKQKTLNFIMSLDVQFPGYNVYDVDKMSYIEEPGVIISSDYGDDPDSGDIIGGCEGCSNEGCKTCGNPNAGIGMVKIIHNMHINEMSPRGLVQTTVITKNPNK